MKIKIKMKYDVAGIQMLCHDWIWKIQIIDVIDYFTIWNEMKWHVMKWHVMFSKIDVTNWYSNVM